MAANRNSAATHTDRVDPDDGDRAYIDSFLERNREELTASILKARAAFAQGIHSHMTVDDIIAAGLKRHRDR